MDRLCPRAEVRFDERFCSCGCGRLAPLAKRNDSRRGYIKGKPVCFIRGHGRGNLRHGYNRRGKRTAEHYAYTSAKQRCTNPKTLNWKDYGGRGIKFLFTNFQQFLAYLGPRPEGMSLDRINNDGHYEPGNVRWATMIEQIINRRKFCSIGQFSTAELQAELTRRLVT